MTGIALRAQGLSVAPKASIIVLKGLDLTIQQGEHVAIMGPSGVGKTTLLRVFAGLLGPVSGHLEVMGRVASIYQDYRLVGQRSALANVLDGACTRYRYGFPGAALKREAVALLEHLGLGARAQVRVEHLSGGEQQRVALARALMSNPQILLADEPVAALDTPTAHALLQLLTRIAQERGITLIMVLHQEELAQRYASRIVRLAQPEQASKPDMPAVEAAIIAGMAQSLPEAVQSRPLRGVAFVLLLGILGLVYGSAVHFVAPDGLDLSGALSNIARFVGQLIPTSQQLSALDWTGLAQAMAATLAMALLATTLAVLGALPLAALAAKNVGWPIIRSLVRAGLNGVRAVPSILWALLAVGALGLGALPGVAALAIYSIGYLTKFYYETFEAVPHTLPEALQALGMGRVRRFFAVIWPQTRLALLSNSIFMLEYNFRTATVLGVVGAGGLGYELKLAIDWGNWHIVGIILLALIVAVIVFDGLAARGRAALK
jgi:phosphonate transport system permease protein